MWKTFKEYITSSGKWGFVLAAVIIGDIYGIVASYQTNLLLPTWVWWLTLIVILLVSPFIAFRKVWLRHQELQNTIINIEESRPNIEFKGSKQEVMRLGGVPLDEDDVERYPHITRLIFVNNPEYPTDNMEAHNVLAHVTFYTATTRPKEIFSMYGNWVAKKRASQQEYTEINLLSNGRPYELDLLLKYQDEKYCYGYGYNTSGATHLDMFNINNRLDIGIYRVQVILQGSNVKEEFNFAIFNKGEQQSLVIEQIIGFIQIDHSKLR